MPQGIALDQNFSLNELIGLAERFHGINPNSVQTWTLPTIAADNADLGDVLYVDQPAAQQMLVDIFGNTLATPADPPPNEAGQDTRTTRGHRPHDNDHVGGHNDHQVGQAPHSAHDYDDEPDPGRARITTQCPAPKVGPRVTRKSQRAPAARCSTRGWRT